MCNKLAIRVCLGMVLGAGLGALCFWGFVVNTAKETGNMVEYAYWGFDNPMMWMSVTNRAMIGFVVGLAGFMMFHPIFGFRLYPFFRGFMMGIFVSLPYALGVFLSPEKETVNNIFLVVLIAGGVMGMVLDLIMTKVAGEGAILLDKKCGK